MSADAGSANGVKEAMTQAQRPQENQPVSSISVTSTSSIGNITSSSSSFSQPLFAATWAKGLDIFTNYSALGNETARKFQPLLASLKHAFDEYQTARRNFQAQSEPHVQYTDGLRYFTLNALYQINVRFLFLS